MDEYISFPDEIHPPLGEGDVQLRRILHFYAVQYLKSAMLIFLPHTCSMHHFFKYPMIITVRK